jgi:hypothetical protein
MNGKFDFWSDQPYTHLEYQFTPAGSPTVGIPGRIDGDYGMRLKEHVSLSLEISLTFRL